MDIEAIVKRFVKQGHDEADTRRSIDEYLSIPLTLPVDDEPMRRLSQVLTNNGYITTSTCEGHGKCLPHVFLHCESQDHLRHLAHVLARESGAKNYQWQLTAESFSPWEDNLLFYVLEPKAKKINPHRDYDKLIQDLDIIGIYVMDYFNEIQADLEKEAAERKAKEEKGLRSTSERICELGNMILFAATGIAFSIKPSVNYIWDGEQEDYKAQGTIVEEFMDGFEVQTNQVVLNWQEAFEKYSVKIAGKFRLRHLVCDTRLVYSFPAKSD